ncbi:MAG: hypothetical protein EOO89_17150 [Pedobacter sp.]|nr:MAG: hypothetical protein EOO89_17150 [Pedobacter sp.]
MMKSYLVALLLLTLGSIQASACSCGLIDIPQRFQRADFIAKVKILNVKADPDNNIYHNAEIKVITLYKGVALDSIKIMSDLNSSCAFLPKANTTWLIFASKKQGLLSFDFCSGSEQIDEKFDQIKYPNAAHNQAQKHMRIEKTLTYIKDNLIKNPNPSWLYPLNAELDNIKGYKNEDGFSVFQVDVKADLSVSKIKTLKKFQNNALHKAVLGSMKKNLRFYKTGLNKLTAATQVIVFCYYYEKTGTEQSYVSLFLL